MAVTYEQHKRFLESLKQIFEESGLETILETLDNSEPLDILTIRFGSIGKNNAVLDLNINFVAISSMASFHLLQLFFEVNRSIEVNSLNELHILTNAINSKIPLGTFGYLLHNKTYYLKHNYVMSEDFEHIAGMHLRMVQQQCTLLLGVLNSFIDGITAVINQEINAQEALESNEFSELFIER